MINRSLQPEIQDLDNLTVPLPRRTTLSNGIPLAIIDAGEQDVVRMDILFAGGRWQQAHKLQALFTNRMLREGSRKYTAADIAEKLDYYGAWLELSSSSEYAYITLYSLNKYFAETLEIIESILKEPTFPEKELNTVLDANIQQFLVNSSKVDFLAQRSLLKTLYGPGHPCGRLIEETDYRLVTPDMLREFYNEYYHSDNCAVFLSGIFTEQDDALQSAVKLGTVTIPRQHPDYLKLRVLMTLFGGYFGSRLMSNIREDKGYTYGISAGTMFYPDSGILLISTETDNEYVEPLIREIYHEIDKLHTGTVSEAELSMVRNYMLGEMCRNYESPFSLADAWMFIHTSGLDDAYFTRSLQAVKEVTPEEIRELANRYLCKETLKEVIAGKKLS